MLSGSFQTIYFIAAMLLSDVHLRVFGSVHVVILHAQICRSYLEGIQQLRSTCQVIYFLGSAPSILSNKWSNVKRNRSYVFLYLLQHLLYPLVECRLCYPPYPTVVHLYCAVNKIRNKHMELVGSEL